MDTVDYSFGQWLQRRRQALHLTQQQLGQLAGCSAAMIRKIEADERRPSPDVLRLLADALQIPDADHPAFQRFARGALEDMPALPPPPAAPAPMRLNPINLPAPLTSLIGREQEVASVRRLLEQEDVRLVTLTGPGGIGKTRLALQLAHDLGETFADGVYFIELSALDDATLVAAAIASGLGVDEAGGRPLDASLTAYLSEKHLLLVLDNFEQVRAAGPLLHALLRAAPRLKLLVTSRVVLGVYGEHDVQVPPLTMPDLTRLPPPDQLARYDAIRLFTERAQAAKDGFALTEATAAAVAEICVRLDGLPLAIELAAARIRLLPPQALLHRLSNRLTLLTGGAGTLPARQQTLRNTLAWSYDLLASDEQTLFRRLGVFAGGATLEAVEWVCNAAGDLPFDALDGLQSLLDASLLQQVEGTNGEPRFRQLETIREFAAEQLHAHGEHAVVQLQHASYFLTLVEQAELHKLGAAQRVWIDRLDADLDNLRAALEWSLSGGDAEIGIRLAVALWGFWVQVGFWSEGHAWTQRALACDASLAPAAYARLLIAASDLMWRMDSDLTRARALAVESVARCEDQNDAWGRAWALLEVGHVAREIGDYAEASARYHESLACFRAHDDAVWSAYVLGDMAIVAVRQGAYAPAKHLFAESLALFQATHHDIGTAQMLGWQAMLAYYEANYGTAEERAQAALALLSATLNRGDKALALAVAGLAALRCGAIQQAAARLTEMLALAREVGSAPALAEALAAFGRLLVEQRKYGQAARILGAIEQVLITSTPNLPTTPTEYQRSVVTVRGHLGEEAFIAAWSEGQAMSLEQAVAYALADHAASNA